MIPTRLILASIFAIALTSTVQAGSLHCDNNGRCFEVASEAPTRVKTARSYGRKAHRSERSVAHLGAGIVRSNKTGATARVGSAHAAAFQAYVDDLEAHGASIKFMGGIRPGPCWSGGLHPCGKALDVCQYARGVVDRRCNLPSAQAMFQIAARHGLFEGGAWCHGDKGHAQVGVSAGACGSNLYSALRKFKRKRLARITQHHLQ